MLIRILSRAFMVLGLVGGVAVASAHAADTTSSGTMMKPDDKSMMKSDDKMMKSDDEAMNSDKMMKSDDKMMKPDDKMMNK